MSDKLKCSTNPTPNNSRELKISLAQSKLIAQRLCRHRPEAKRDEISKTIFPRPRRTRREICGEKVKSALLQLAGAGDRSDFKFVESVFNRVPELKEY